MEAVIFFCSSMYNLDKLGTELKKNFFCSLIGCTTAGEISSKGYQKGGIVGVSLSARDLKLHSRFISSLDRFSFQKPKKSPMKSGKSYCSVQRLIKKRCLVC
jgi:hypothetical protein